MLRSLRARLSSYVAAWAHDTRSHGAAGNGVAGHGHSVSGRAPEIHLFVLWDKARPWADRIVEDIASHFRIIDGIELRWTPRLAARHYTRLYGQSLPSRSRKVRECGTGFPLVLVVRDDVPQYAARRKWGRTYEVNARLFDAKARYRRWVGASSVHCSTDMRETEHDLFLMLGRRVADYARRPREVWSGVFRPVHRDLTGNGGWRSREELFTAIDLTLHYVALPPVDGGPEIRLLLEGWWSHWGVEWLIADPERHPDGMTTRVFPVVVGGREIAVKLHHVGDGHHDARWQTAMLQRRVRGVDGAYLLEPHDAYLELLHEVVRQDRASAADAARLAALAEAAGYPVPEVIQPAGAAVELERHLVRHGYEMPRPRATGPRPARFAFWKLARRLGVPRRSPDAAGRSIENRSAVP